ncbi:hypothetical protein DFH28DRAFT_593630 [Melampsora americana]|nr:hypothetical protein DFH28DRAFT_593630 [Melampsora americana]
MSHNSSGRPYLGHHNRSQDQANSAFDKLFELEIVGGRLLWPSPNLASANVESNATTNQTTRSSSIVFDFGHDSPGKENVPLAKMKQPLVADKLTVVQQMHNVIITLGFYMPAANSGSVRNNAKVKWIQH